MFVADLESDVKVRSVKDKGKEPEEGPEDSLSKLDTPEVAVTQKPTNYERSKDKTSSARKATQDSSAFSLENRGFSICLKPN